MLENNNKGEARMDDSIIIKSIHIKNFRSIRNINIEVSRMNVFVGLNDAGKSNILKALNLFFNGNTNYDSSFDFDRDFTLLFPEKSHSAKEIVVELELIIPPKFKDSGIYKWKKVWRKNDNCKESIVNYKGKEPSPRSKIPSTLNRIRFRYVPAVKSKEYYKFLLSELYLTAAGSLNDPLVESTRDFADVIRNYTEQIHQEVGDKIGIDSRLTIPNDMTDMFRALVFMTSGEDKDKLIPLDMRGDGIQARHIPIILKYLADKDQSGNGRGIVKTTTIWGYEEPENGIELLKSFEVFSSFHEYSSQIQMFITTHSPAFYQQESHDYTKILFVRKEEYGDTIVSASLDKLEIGKSMGLMPLVAPYISTARKELEEQLSYLHSNLIEDVPTLFVEGKTDKQLISLAIEELSPKLNELLYAGKFKIFSKEGEGGCDSVVNWVLAWIHMGNKSKAMAIFDKDEAGEEAYNKLKSNDVYQGKRSNNIRINYLPVSDEIKSILEKKLLMHYEIEHLLSIACWKKMKKKGFVVERSNKDLVYMLGKHANKNKSTVEVLEELIPEKDIRDTIVYNEPASSAKEKIIKMIKNEPDNVKKEYISGFKYLIDVLEKQFANDNTK